MPDQAKAIMTQLAIDGRTSYATLAERADTSPTTARQLSQTRQARLTSTVAAGPVIALSTWLRTVEELHRLELTFAEQLPQLQVVDRLVVLRVVKRMGRLINEGGRSTGVIPVNIWDDLLCGDRSPGT